MPLNLGGFYPNREHAKDRKQLDAELDEVELERIRRQGHGLYTEDRDCGYDILKNARDALN